MNKTVLIPAYCPDDKLLNLLPELKENGFDVVIVDDGSGNDYADIFNKAGQYGMVISYPENKGKGHALKEGLKYLSNKDTVIVTMDADGQHSVRDALRLAELSKENPDSLILGVREFGKGTPLRSLLGNKITSFFFKLNTGRKLSDTQTGLRAFMSKDIPFYLKCEGERYDYEMNVLADCAENDIPFVEETIETIYLDNNSSSHFHVLRDSYLIYKRFLSFIISSLFCFLLDYFLYIVFYNIFRENVTIANILARCISAFINYQLNRNLVFKKNHEYSFIQYALLALFILVFNTCILNVLVNIMHLNTYLAKPVTELILFIISYTVQKNVVFKERSFNAN